LADTEKDLFSAAGQSMSVCAGCQKRISNHYITALDKVWHPKCFRCKSCNKTIAQKAFLTFHDKPFHEGCLNVPVAVRQYPAATLIMTRLLGTPAATENSFQSFVRCAEIL